MRIKEIFGVLLVTMTVGIAPARADTFVVGVELPLTGALARSGTGVNEGVQIAAELFNAAGGRHKIKLVVVDDESQPAKAVAAVEKLLSQGAIAITGGYGSHIIAPASEAADKAGVVYITSGGADDKLSARGFPGFFRINGSVSVAYPRAMNQLIQEQGLKSVSIIYSTREPTTRLAKDVVGLLGDKVKTTLHPFDPATTDFKPLITKIKLQDKPDAIIMSAYEPDYVGILRAARVVKPDVKAMIGAWLLATPKMASDFPDLMNLVYGTSALPYPPNLATDDGKAFLDAFRKTFNRDPDYTSVFGYTQAIVLFEAISRAADKGDVKAKNAVADEMRAAKRDTLLGVVDFNAQGDNMNYKENIGQFQGGKIVLVSPPQRATGTMIFPGVPW